MEELTKLSLYQAVIAEFVATLLFLYITVATVIGYKHQSDSTLLGNKDGACSGVGVLGIAWAFGGMIFVLVYCTAGISDHRADLKVLPSKRSRKYDMSDSEAFEDSLDNENELEAQRLCGTVEAAAKAKDVTLTAGATAADYAKQGAVKDKDVTLSAGETALEYTKGAVKAKDVTVGAGQTTIDYAKQSAGKYWPNCRRLRKARSSTSERCDSKYWSDCPRLCKTRSSASKRYNNEHMPNCFRLHKARSVKSKRDEHRPNCFRLRKARSGKSKRDNNKHRSNCFGLHSEKYILCADELYQWSKIYGKLHIFLN